MASPGWVVPSAVGASCGLVLSSPRAFLIITVFLAGTPATAGLMTADPGHMAQALALIAAGDPAIPMEEFDCVVYVAQD